MWVHGTHENRLLKALSPADRSLLQAYLEPVHLDLKQVLEAPDTAVDYVYFPSGGLASVVASISPRYRIEVAMIGHEGMTGLSVVLGDDFSANEILIQSPGEALRLPSSALREAMRESSTLNAVLRRYVHSFLIQASHTALANGCGKLAERLARWLVMWQDRVQEPTLTVTHEFLALLLGVRRPGITVALHDLEGRGLIRATRTNVRILNRGGLMTAANGFYGAAELQYDRMLEMLPLPLATTSELALATASGLAVPRKRPAVRPVVGKPPAKRLERA
ncbi:Crp/Fnr family transcriptional regulator [soil metagenome]